MPAKKKVSVVPDFEKPAANLEANLAPPPVKKVVKKVIKKPAEDLSKYTVGAGESTDENVPLERRNKQLLIIGSILSAIVLISAVVIFYYRGSIEFGSPDEEAEAVTTEEVEVGEVVEVQTEESSEEQSNALAREDISLEILNGSGVPGAAGETADEFEALGYEIAEIGNAEAIEASELYLSSEVSEEEAVNLLDDADRLLDISEVAGTIDDLASTARIILGSQ